MNVQDCREHYYTFSASLSSVSRQLSFAGIAVVWIFVQKEGNQYIIPDSLVSCLIFFVLGLASDLFQYMYASAAWGLFARRKEKSCGNEASFKAPWYINLPTLTFFWIKAILVIIGYVNLLIVLMA
ncbi:hypothetical protein [Thaumasiovibrio sp. DFM-14]|uniref:hypothetical protein n=1 Tax=Thaumasiovibrio sp. DFM-14 TaxID=3384792 RepID=UPI00399F9195